MIHPIKKTREIIEALKLTVLNFQKLLLALGTAVRDNTAATSALLETAKSTLAAAKAAEAACSYLARAERHRREQTGQVTNV
jgi:hypothetical protein